MRKLILISMLVLVAAVSFAGLKEEKVAQFGATGTADAALALTIDGQNGFILDKSMYLSVTTNATMSIYTPSQVTKSDAASATNSIVIHTSASNVLNGVRG